MPVHIFMFLELWLQVSRVLLWYLQRSDGGERWGKRKEERGNIEDEGIHSSKKEVDTCVYEDG